jgi:hypothetical protein
MGSSHEWRDGRRVFVVGEVEVVGAEVVHFSSYSAVVRTGRYYERQHINRRSSHELPEQRLAWLLRCEDAGRTFYHFLQPLEKYVPTGGENHR